MTSTSVLIMNFGEEEVKIALGYANELRSNNIATEVYPDTAKMKKQMSYANNRNIPVVIMAGANEISQGLVQVKNMKTGEQVSCPASELSEMVKEILN